MIILGDIIVTGLTHYYDWDSDMFAPLTMALKTDASMVPHVILFDCSDEKKDSAVLRLISSCNKISSSMKVSLNQQATALTTLVDKCLLQTYSDVYPNVSRLSCDADMIAYSIMIPESDEMLSLTSDISEDIFTEIDIMPLACRLSELDDMLLYELDPLLLRELDYYGLGARLETSAYILEEFSLELENQDAQLQSSMVDMDVSPPVSYYDEYLLMDLDGYKMSELDEKI